VLKPFLLFYSRDTKEIKGNYISKLGQFCDEKGEKIEEKELQKEGQHI
jgi:hypothetical protein